MTIGSRSVVHAFDAAAAAVKLGAHEVTIFYRRGEAEAPAYPHAIELARSGRLGPIHTVYADIRYRGGSRHDWLPEQPLPPREELDWDFRS